MPLPLLESRKLFDTPADALPLITFRAHGNDYQGLQYTAYEGDERAWDNDDYGRWRGPFPLHTMPFNLAVVGASYESDKSTFAETARVATSTDITLQWNLPDAIAIMEDTPYREVPDGGKLASVTWRIILQSASSGVKVADFSQKTATTAHIGIIPDGSYVAWVRAESMRSVQNMPPDYFEETGYSGILNEYRYEVDGQEYIWDWRHDVGLRPSDPQQLAIDGITDMYAEHEALMLAGKLETFGKWTSYITLVGNQEGEWSALPIVVGSGDFTVGNDALPAPGAALVVRDGETTQPVAFDILARSISAAKVLSDGSCRISGAWATRNGPALGYWTLHSDGTSTQLGCSTASQFYVCEMSLLNHFASDIWADADGQEWILTKAKLRRYDPLRDDVHRTLIAVPQVTDGWPGGRCLRRDGALKFFTENFVQNAGNFYNKLEIQGDSRTTGIGTVFHGDNCAELYLGDYYGWRQDGPFSERGTQHLARMVYNEWDVAGMPDFSADIYRWQRLAAVGNKMIAAGKKAHSELPIWGVTDGREFREASNEYRVRRMDNTGNETYAVAFTLDGDEKQWAGVAFSGEFVKACFTWNDTTQSMAASVEDLEESGVDISQLPNYLLWNELETANGGGVWVQTDEEPSSGIYLTKGIAAGLVQYVGTLPYDSDVWNRFCFIVMDDGSVDPDALEPEPACTDAACAADLFIDAQYICIRLDANVAPFYGVQVSDVNEFVTRVSRKLDIIAKDIPNLWARVDSAASVDDLSSYNVRVPWNRKVLLETAANSHIDVCVLMESGYGKVNAPVVELR